MENDHILLASRAGVVLVVMLAVYWVWKALAVLLVVLLAAWLINRHLTVHYATLLTPSGKTVLITGCDTGIGHDTAVAAAKAGLMVIACCYDAKSRGADKLRNTSARIYVKQLDVTSDKDVESVCAVVAELCGTAGLWAVINNAGLNRQAPVELTSMATFKQLADVMLFGTVRVTRALLPLIRKAKGRVITVSSDRGMLSPANSAAYCVAKHGIESFSDVLRAEMVRFGVDVSVVQPGHFGGATAIIDDSAIEAMRASLEQDFEQASEDAQQTYGREVIDKVIDTSRASRLSSPTDVTPVVKAMLDAMLNKHPATRYPVQGMLGVADWGIVLGQVRPVLPDRFVDWIQRVVMGNK